MFGISPTVASHKLNVLPTAKLVRQRVRWFHPDGRQIIQTEVNNLLAARFIREVKYPEWLANVVVVPKNGVKWHVCVDYTDLNEACPKDSFPLATNRSNCGCNSRAWHSIISARVLRVPSYSYAPS